MADPAIKLFGKTIPLTESGSSSDSDPNPTTTTAEEDKDISKQTTNDEIKDEEVEAQKELERGKLNSSSAPSENDQQTSSQNVVQVSDSKTEPDLCETDASGAGQDKVLKKPDKILPCPRCNSLDTKFCYYNNYNVNQPRHFCKNCQRYWTAGGTMRNVPVGAGRRKNKHNASSHYRQIMMSPEALATARGEVIDSCRPPISIKSSSEGNGTTVFKFGPEAQAPICESVTSVLNIGEQKRSDVRSEEPSCVSSSMPASHLVENQNGLPQNDAHKEQPNPNGMHGYYPLQCYPWAYPWSPGWNNAAAAAMTAGRCSSELVNGSEMSNMNSLQWGPLPIWAAPSFFAAPFPIPFMPSPAFWPTGTWNVPCAGGSNGGLSAPSSKSSSGCLGSSYPALGKHSRDGSLQGENNTEKSLWVPKTLRIDDPDEAAKSSIWATLGIKPYEGGGIFKPLQSKDGSKCPKSNASKVLHANPAAVSRFQSFQEST